MRARDVYLRTVRGYRRRAGYLLLLGLVVFVPLGFVDALANQVQEHVGGGEEVFDLAQLGLLAGILAQGVTALLGEVFYAGAVGLVMQRGEDAPSPSLREVAARLSYGRLIAVDILFGLGTGIGLLLLIVPGIIFFGWFALAGPVVEIEERGVRAAFRRSRQLVRGSFWTVVLVLIPITVASELLAGLLLELPHLVIHEPLLRDWVGETLSSILVSPVYAVAAVLMTLQLARRRASGEAGDAGDAGTSSRPA